MIILQVVSKLVFVLYYFPFADGDCVILIRIGQSKFVMVPINEDSQERILNGI
jgi:hypothetical protein